MKMPKSARRRCSHKADENKKPKLWTAKLRPYAQRATFALHYKGIDYEPIEVDMKDKPAELLKISPYGQVPAMIDQGNPIYESNICVEYIDETWESLNGIDLLPSEPYGKAKARMWCDFIEKRIITPFFCMRKEEERKIATQRLLEGLAQISKEMSKSSGPFFDGPHIGMVDVAFAPFVNRMIIAEHFFDFSIPRNEKYMGFHRWWDAIQQHPSYIATKIDNSFLIHYARNKLMQLSARKCKSI